MTFVWERAKFYLRDLRGDSAQNCAPTTSTAIMTIKKNEQHKIILLKIKEKEWHDGGNIKNLLVQGSRRSAIV